jgi:hypothetical protein
MSPRRSVGGPAMLKLTTGPRQRVLRGTDDTGNPRCCHPLHHERVGTHWGQPKGQRLEGLAHGHLAPQVDTDAGLVVLVLHIGRDRLDHDRVAELLRGGDRLVGRLHRDGRPELHPVCRQQRLGLGLRQRAAPPGVSARTRSTRRSAAAAVQACRLDHLPVIASSPLSVTRRGNQRANGILRHRVGRDRPSPTRILTVLAGQCLRDPVHAEKGCHARFSRTGRLSRTTAWATSSSEVINGWMKQVRTLSTRSSPKAASRAVGELRGPGLGR